MIGRIFCSILLIGWSMCSISMWCHLFYKIRSITFKSYQQVIVDLLIPIASICLSIFVLREQVSSISDNMIYILIIVMSIQLKYATQFNYKNKQL